MKAEGVAKEKAYGQPKLMLLGPQVFLPGPLRFCSGCHYGIIIRLLSEVIEELGIAGRTIALSSASCTVLFAMYIDKIDFVDALHGLAPAVATAIKRVHPNTIVFTVQGDGDLGAIGLGHWVSALLRAERLTTIFLNNACFGMTGGQMAPTTLTGMQTTTTSEGRDPRMSGFPLHAAELAATMKGVAYSARCTVHTPANYQRSKRAIKTAFQKQIDGIGYGIVEFLSACPTTWGLTPVECLEFIDERMIPEFPLGEFKNVDIIEH